METLDVILEDFDKEVCDLEEGMNKKVYDMVLAYIRHAYKEGTKNPGNLN